MADWGPVLLFIVLTPGLPGNNGRFAELHSMRTSGAAISVHALLFFGFCAILMIAAAGSSPHGS
jgi:hypothetical protein